jgi:hypothetical protein
MKRQLYLYLFILSTLVAAFTYMYYSKALSFEMKKNESEIKYYKDSIAVITNKLFEADHFSLENNDFAKEYFVDYDVQNHRWIIADYSDGQYWGDVVIKYFVEKDGKITFQLIDTFIYPKQEY